MPDVRDFPATGKVTKTLDGQVVFCPANTNYEMHLGIAGAYSGPIGKPIQAVIRVTARKMHTVTSGGNFIAPIFGSPRLFQGRGRYLDQRSIAVQAGTPVVVQLPAADAAMDMECGAIGVGSLVNVLALAGATFELLQTAAAK